MLPQAFLDRMQARLGTDFPAFVAALSTESPVSLRTNPSKWQTPSTLERVPWTGNGYYLPQRPVFTLDPLWHAGSYYVQEASSMLLEQAVCQHLDTAQPIRALDLCAAPGGKSTHLQSLLSADSLLVANEVIRSRARILRENLVRWGSHNVIVSNNDPRDFALLPAFFDLMVVDAPCSGEGLFRKDPEAVNEWSPAHLQLCVERQQRILMDVWEALRPGGLLVYSTCTYHPAENEANLAWLAQRQDLNSLTLDLPVDWGFQTLECQGIVGYQAMPHRVKGEGFFMAVLRKAGESGEQSELPVRKNKLETLVRKERESLQDWLLPGQRQWGRVGERVFCYPTALQNVWEGLYERLNIVSGGLLVAEQKAKGWIPSHALAMSHVFRQEAFPSTALDWETAIRYLQRETINTRLPNGWGLVSYADQVLGWVKQIGHRSNNYYPQEWRIRMARPEQATWSLANP